MRLIYGQPAGAGWHPITHMVRLLADLLDAELVMVSTSRPANVWRRFAGLGPRRRGRDSCLVIAGEARHLNTLLQADYWLRGSKNVAGWVIDSFWTDRIPYAVRHRKHFDRLFVADKEVVGLWASATGVPVSWLPWGSDVLRLGSGEGKRPIDLQRLGRQPPGWENDEETRRACEAAGLRFAGRPALHNDASVGQMALMKCLSRAKFTLAFSNSVSPAPYTHPSREYLTGRWTDSIASGAVVAGISPKCAATNELLWPAATFELSTTDRQQGIERIVAAVDSWSSYTALDNYRRATKHLDWRWRFKELAAALDLTSERLDAELASLTESVD